MSETAIFIVGTVVWAITVWGVVMAGGYLLGRGESYDDTGPDDTGSAGR